MPWLSEAKKDVTSCDKLRGGANIRYIRRFLNGATHHDEDVVSVAIQRQTQGTETSKYLEENKTKVIPLVVAIERGKAQTDNVLALSGLKDR